MPLFDPNERPTEKRFDQVSGSLQHAWRDGLQSMGVAEALYFRSVNIWAALEAARPSLVGKRPQYHSGSATALVNQAVDAHLAFDARFTKLPATPSDDSKSKADKVEATLQVIYNDAVSNVTHLPTKVNGKNLVLYNYTPLGTMLRSRKPERPKRGRGQSLEEFERQEWEWVSQKGSFNPIELIVPRSGELLMDPTTTTPNVAIWRRKIKAWQLSDLTTRKVERFGGKVFNIRNMDPEQDILIEEWWSPRWVSMKQAPAPTSQGQFFTEPNTWGVQPFSHIFGGTEISPVNKEQNVKWWIEQSLIFTVRETILMEWQATAAHHNSLMRTAFARYGSEMDSAEAAEQLEADVLQGEADQWWIENTPQLAPQSFQHLTHLNDSIEKSTYSSQAAGFRQSGVDTATAQIILSEATNRTFKAIVTKMGDLYGESAETTLKMLFRQSKEFGKDKEEDLDYTKVGFGDHEFDISDIEEHFAVIAQFEQVDAVVAAQEKQEAREELAFDPPLQSWAGYQKLARRENASKLRREIIDDMITKDPEYVAELVIVALRNKDMRVLADRKEQKLKELRLQGQNGLVGTDGQPIGTNGREAQ